jgi:hypothetical protein
MGLVSTHVDWVQLCGLHRFQGDKVGCLHEHAGDQPKYPRNVAQFGAHRVCPDFPPAVMANALQKEWCMNDALGGETTCIQPGPNWPDHSVSAPRQHASEAGAFDLNRPAVRIHPYGNRSAVPERQDPVTLDSIDTIGDICPIMERKYTQPPFSACFLEPVNRTGVFSYWWMQDAVTNQKRLYMLTPAHVAKTLRRPPPFVAYDPKTTAVTFNTHSDYVIVQCGAYESGYLPAVAGHPIRPLEVPRTPPPLKVRQAVYVITQDKRLLKYRITNMTGTVSVSYEPVSQAAGGSTTVGGDSGALVCLVSGVPVGMHIAAGTFVPFSAIELFEALRPGQEHRTPPLVTGSWSDMRKLAKPIGDFIVRQHADRGEGAPPPRAHEVVQNGEGDLEDDCPWVLPCPPTASILGGQFADEPFFCLPSPEAQKAAACVQNQLVHADYAWVADQCMRHTNVSLCTVRAQLPPRPWTPGGASNHCQRWRHDICALYQPGYFTVFEHGNALHSVMPIRHTEHTRVWLEAHEIVALLHRVIMGLVSDNCHFASPEHGGVRTKDIAPARRLRGVHLTIPPECLTWPDLNFDSRLWDRTLSGPPEDRAMISVLGPATPRRRPHFTPAILFPGPLHHVRDKEVDGYEEDGIPALSQTPRACMICVNHKSFYTNVDAAIGQLKKDMGLGIVEGPFRLPPITPFRVDPSSIAIKTDLEGVESARNCTDGGDANAPMLAGRDISRNACEDDEGDPRIHAVLLPMVTDFAFNLAVMYTLLFAVMEGWGPPDPLAPVSSFSDEGGFINVSPASFIPVAGCADKKRWYRQFAVHWSALWLQMAIILCTGITLDLGMQFGQASAVQIAQRRLNNILDVVYTRVYNRVSVWSLWTPHGPRPQVDPARCWDSHPAVYGWRQRRYDMAIAKGLDPHEAVREAFPFNKHGYIDDSMSPTIALFIDLFFEELIAYCMSSGTVLSIPKFQKADAFGRLWTMHGDHTWLAAVRGCLAPLGKYLVMNLQGGLVKEKPARISQIVARTQAFLATSEDHRLSLVSYDEFEQIIGVWMYVAQTNLAIVPLLQYPLRNLHATFRLKVGRTAHLGSAIPLVRRAKKSLELICTVGARNPGIAFAPDTSPIDWTTAIWVVHDAAGDSGVDDYRGHFTMILAPGATHVAYVKGRWTAEQLVNHSTTLEACGGNCGLAEVLIRYPVGDIVECYDSQSATMALRRLGCSSLPLSAQVAQRGRILEAYGKGRRLFIFWFPRELNKITDAGSKDEMRTVQLMLAQRGLPPLATEPLPPAHPPTFGPVLQSELLSE